MLPRKVKIFSLGFVFFVFALIILIWKFNSSLEPSSDLDDYRSALDAVPPELVEHFPKVVRPSDQARFYFRPGFLQGGTAIQLRLIGNAASLQTLRSRYAPLAASQSRGCPREGNFPELRLRMRRFDAPVDPKCHYDVYVLQASSPEDWNHGHESGIAISDNRNEVFYWAKVW